MVWVCSCIIRRCDMQYIVDAVILIPILVSVAIAYQKGFFSTLLSFMSGFVSMISSYIISPYVYDFLYKTEVNAKIKESAILMINDAEKESMGAGGAAGRVDSIVDSLSVPDPLKEIIRASGRDGGLNIFDIEGFKIQTADMITEICMRILSYVLVFAAITLIFFTLRAVAKSIKKLPVLKEADKAMGAVLGFFRGLIVSLIIVAVILFVRFNNADEGINELIDNSVIMNTVIDGKFFESIVSGENNGDSSEFGETETRMRFSAGAKATGRKGIEEGM